MSKITGMSVQDKKWQAESDARTLAESRVILSDPGRLKLAAKEAQKIAADKMTEAKAMKSIANKAPKSSPRGGKKK